MSLYNDESVWISLEYIWNVLKNHTEHDDDDCGCESVGGDNDIHPFMNEIIIKCRYL